MRPLDVSEDGAGEPDLAMLDRIGSAAESWHRDCCNALVALEESGEEFISLTADRGQLVALIEILDRTIRMFASISNVLMWVCSLNPIHSIKAQRDLFLERKGVKPN